MLKDRIHQSKSQTLGQQETDTDYVIRSINEPTAPGDTEPRSNIPVATVADTVIEERQGVKSPSPIVTSACVAYHSYAVRQQTPAASDHDDDEESIVYDEPFVYCQNY